MIRKINKPIFQANMSTIRLLCFRRCLCSYSGPYGKILNVTRRHGTVVSRDKQWKDMLLLRVPGRVTICSRYEGRVTQSLRIVRRLLKWLVILPIITYYNNPICSSVVHPTQWIVVAPELWMAILFRSARNFSQTFQASVYCYAPRRSSHGICRLSADWENISTTTTRS